MNKQTRVKADAPHDELRLSDAMTKIAAAALDVRAKKAESKKISLRYYHAARLCESHSELLLGTGPQYLAHKKAKRELANAQRKLDRACARVERLALEAQELGGVAA